MKEISQLSDDNALKSVYWGSNDPPSRVPPSKKYNNKSKDTAANEEAKTSERQSQNKDAKFEFRWVLDDEPEEEAKKGEPSKDTSSSAWTQPLKPDSNKGKESIYNASNKLSFAAERSSNGHESESDDESVEQITISLSSLMEMSKEDESDNEEEIITCTFTDLVLGTESRTIRNILARLEGREPEIEEAPQQPGGNIEAESSDKHTVYEKVASSDIARTCGTITPANHSVAGKTDMIPQTVNETRTNVTEASATSPQKEHVIVVTNSPETVGQTVNEARGHVIETPATSSQKEQVMAVTNSSDILAEEKIAVSGDNGIGKETISNTTDRSDAEAKSASQGGSLQVPIEEGRPSSKASKTEESDYYTATNGDTTNSTPQSKSEGVNEASKEKNDDVSKTLDPELAARMAEKAKAISQAKLNAFAPTFKPTGAAAADATAADQYDFSPEEYYEPEAEEGVEADEADYNNNYYQYDTTFYNPVTSPVQTYYANPYSSTVSNTSGFYTPSQGYPSPSPNSQHSHHTPSYTVINGTVYFHQPATTATPSPSFSAAAVTDDNRSFRDAPHPWMND